MNSLYKHMLNNPVYYVTRDIERALGLVRETESFFIISNKNTFAKTIGDKNIAVIESDSILGTRELLEKAMLKKGSNVIIFKNTRGMERIADENNWILLNPPASLSSIIEEKISQVAWLGALGVFLPPHSISPCGDLLWQGKEYIVQFNHAHSGEGTMLIKSQRDVDTLKQKFPNRPVRVTQFVEGPIFTINGVVHSSGVMISSPSYQITGITPFTENMFTTIGNDWGIANIMLSVKQKKQLDSMARQVGEKMKIEGWKGLFGIDVVLEESTGNIYLIEINARQPASTTYESQLQQNNNTVEFRCTTFEAHLSALLDIDLNGYELIDVKNGAQIIQRITQNIKEVPHDLVDKIKSLGCTAMEYNNFKIGSELLRIQSDGSFLEKHISLNDLGKKVADELKKYNRFW